IRRNELIKTLENLIRGSGKRTKWVISSRFTDYKHEYFDEEHFTEWELLPLDKSLREKLARKLIPELRNRIPNSFEVEDVDFLDALKSHPRISTWGKNPLLFSLAAILFVTNGKLPEKRRDLYLEVIDTIIKLREISTWEITRLPLAGSI